MSSDDSQAEILVPPDGVDTAAAAKAPTERPAKTRRKRGGGGRRARVADTIKVPEEETPGGLPPEAKLVLELDLDPALAAAEAQIHSNVAGQQPFSSAEVTAEVDLLDQIATTVVADAQPMPEAAEDEIDLEEPDEVLEELGAERSAAGPTPRGVTPPPHPHKGAPEVPLPVFHEPRYWWERFFNDDYLRSVRMLSDEQVSRQCDFIESRLALQPGASILDVGCGLGAHAVELASRGYAVVGLDISLPMLSRASDEAQERDQRLNFLHADMRELSFESAFDAVLCWGTSFGYFDDEANRQVIERLYRTLKPRGRLMLGVVNRDFVVKSQPNVVWFEGDGCLCMEETSFDFIASRLNVRRTLLMEDGRQRESSYSLRLYTLHELGHLLHHQGFRVGEVSGSEATPGVFFGADSPQMLILAERRANTPYPDAEESNEWEDETAAPRPTLVDADPRFDDEETTGVKQ